jgi:uncharacterized protein involved in type VI secretion and phage assembly
MLVLPSSTSLASRRMRTSLNSVRSTSFAPNCAPLQIRTASLLYRIVQTAVCLVVQPEAYDDAHIIPVGIQHRPAALRLHGGVSIALGEGDAISAETRNANPATSTHGIVTVRRPQAGIVERFELASPDELVCRYTVTDSSTFRLRGQRSICLFVRATSCSNSPAMRKITRCGACLPGPGRSSFWQCNRV